MAWTFCRQKTSAQARNDDDADDGPPADGHSADPDGLPVPRSFGRKGASAGQNGIDAVEHSGSEESRNKWSELWTLPFAGSLARKK